MFALRRTMPRRRPSSSPLAVGLSSRRGPDAANEPNSAGDKTMTGSKITFETADGALDAVETYGGSGEFSVWGVVDGDGNAIADGLRDADQAEGVARRWIARHGGTVLSVEDTEPGDDD